ncbi:MAG: hypothetical protein P0Y53_12910 [Candidatus Pseudobacter hemicellulosilyticus]|uniref:Uncharacterized protein n=1 Tax=Candidatus Pseudobacter hemicellulosilyticus TaxID=3121375 RepID=A0AAJ5WY62_9BACT|nr:MAG: hypothetical protein P0Y53_12910 [Pseudobacter sp.]
MFGSNKQQPETARLTRELDSIETRLDSFLSTLTERADALLEGFVETAPGIMDNDNIHGQAYSRFLAATRGQISTLRQKVQDTRSRQIDPVYIQHQHSLPFGSPAATMLFEWQHRCAEKMHAWEAALMNKESKAIEKAEDKDYALLFKELLDRYNIEKEKVFCQQCGAKLEIDRLYYYSVYISCPFCSSQNIFNPGSSARQLEATARKLAEQRSKPLLEEQEACVEKERECYFQQHELQLQLIHEKNSGKIRETREAISRLEARRQEALQKAPLLLEQYYQMVFEEMSTLLPDLRQHHERFYQAIQASYLQHKRNYSTP